MDRVSSSMTLSGRDAVPEAVKVAGTQTLMRGLALLECVADGVGDVKGIAARLGTRRSTTHRMLNSLVLLGYLHHVPYKGYTLGPQLIRLGAHAVEQRPIAGIARPDLEALARETGDTVHLGILDGTEVFYLDKIPGTRGLEMRSRIGHRMPLALTALGKAIMFGIPRARWQALYLDALGRISSEARFPAWPDYEEKLIQAVGRGWTTDLEENELGIRCVGAPVYDISGTVVASISVASDVSHMSEARMSELGPLVRRAAEAVSRKMGWPAEAQPRPRMAARAS